MAPSKEKLTINVYAIDGKLLHTEILEGGLVYEVGMEMPIEHPFLLLEIITREYKTIIKMVN